MHVFIIKYAYLVVLILKVIIEFNCYQTSTVISIQKTLLILFVTNISARETPEQEIYLQPRNYNPHPYQTVHQLPNPEYQLQGSEAEQNYLQPSSAPPLSNIFKLSFYEM